MQAVTNKEPKKELESKVPLLTISDKTPQRFSKSDASTRKTERSLTLREMKKESTMS